jgi:Glycosyl transferases group 1/Glycosyltransferase Family 4
MKGLRARGHLSELLARAESPLWREAFEAGFNVWPATLRTLAARSSRADLVHAHDARAHTMAAFMASDKLVVSRRVAFPVRSGLGSRWKYRRVRRFLAVSCFVKEKLCNAGIPATTIDVVYDGVDPTPIAGSASADALVALASEDPAKGRDLVERAAVAAGVSIVFSRDLNTDLRDASLFLYISRSEGLGSAALLAMSRGVPVIASRVGGLPEIVRDHETGLLVENNSDAIAAAILELRSDPTLAHRLACNARLLVEREFTLDCMVERTLESYAKTLCQ